MRTKLTVATVAAASVLALLTLFDALANASCAVKWAGAARAAIACPAECVERGADGSVKLVCGGAP